MHLHTVIRVTVIANAREEYSVHQLNCIDVVTCHLLTGSAIVHPLFDRPSSENGQVLFTNVSHFENAAGFADILQLMLRSVLPRGLWLLLVFI